MSGRGLGHTGGTLDKLESIPGFRIHLEVDHLAHRTQALEALAGLFPEGRPLPESCLIAVSGAHLGTLRSHTARKLEDGDELVLIAPVAGG